MIEVLLAILGLIAFCCACLYTASRIRKAITARKRTKSPCGIAGHYAYGGICNTCYLQSDERR